MQFLFLVGADRQRSQITDNAGGDKGSGNKAGNVTILTRRAFLCKGSRRPVWLEGRAVENVLGVNWKEQIM